MLSSIYFFVFKGNLLIRVVISIVLAISMAMFFPEISTHFKILGDLFIQVLKSIAPILVFVLLIASISGQKTYIQKSIRFIILLYFLSTFLASLLSVMMSFAFPVTLPLSLTNTQNVGLGTVPDVISSLLLGMLENPIKALYHSNYISILFWAILIGFGVRSASEMTKVFFQNMSDILSKIVSLAISFAPFGIFGILSSTLAIEGTESLKLYSQIILLLVVTMMIMAFIINPLLVYAFNKKNPYPLIWSAVKTSGITAFFTRSSVANIPVNLKICEELKLDKNVYSVTIPLGATINMAGAAITITILTLATVHTLGEPLYFITTLLLCFLASICAAGSSGIAGGSIMLIPVACNLFGLSPEISGMVMGIGFVIGIIQDSMETALNSSSDVVLTATGCSYFDAKN
ncbi:MAG: serine/threonine transporter SstT [Neisseriaceae bacterium]|nr:MAG: serine/threonine transporter SstT [Neisseriaceae bacterium]